MNTVEMLQEFRGAASELTAGLRLGPFTMDRRGMLCPSSRDQFPAFTVQWQGRPVRARLIQNPAGGAEDSAARLEFSARIGQVPSTAAPRGGQRGGALRLLRQLPALTPPGWRLFIRPDHSVDVEAEATIALPVSASSLVTEVALFVVGLAPYLELLDDEGVAFSTAGMVKI